jgi:outer membrane lipoprotein-sorting protein
MKFLRTVSTRRLLAVIVGVVTAVAAGTALAVAAAGSGPTPPPKRLPQAVHDALAAPAPAGITARISFTNHLIDSTDIQGGDPILTGATGRLWLSNDHRLRLELQSNTGQDAQIVVDKSRFWVYDPSAKTAYEGTLPAGSSEKSKTSHEALPSVAELQRDLNRLVEHANLSGPIPGNVAGQPAYTVRVSPKHDGGLLGAGELAWDAIRGVPLRIAVYARNDTTPVLELKATDISYGAVPASTFAITPPSNAKMVRVDTSGADHAAAPGAKPHQHRVITGEAAVAKRLSFKLNAPRQLVGLPRRSVTLLDWGGQRAALITYGQNLGGVAVLEQPASAAGQAPKNGGQSGVTLPTVSINGVKGQELDTALGTIVRFSREQVSYTVAGSVPAAAADAAARAL